MRPTYLSGQKMLARPTTHGHQESALASCLKFLKKAREGAFSRAKRCHLGGGEIPCSTGLENGRCKTRGKRPAFARSSILFLMLSVGQKSMMKRCLQPPSHPNSRKRELETVTLDMDHELVPKIPKPMATLPTPPPVHQTRRQRPSGGISQIRFEGFGAT